MALGLVILVALVLRLDYPGLRSVQRQAVMMLTSREADWTPMLNKWAREGIWQDSFDKQVFQQTYQETMLLPVSGKVHKMYQSEQHPGVDIVTEEGTLVKAALSGEIIPFSNGPSDNAVAVRHSSDRVTIYAGLQNVTVDVGQMVPQGKVLGVAKNMVHFEMRIKNVPTDPLPYLSVSDTL